MILTTMSLWMCASVHNSSAAMTHLLVRVLLLNHCDRMTGNVPATICRTRQQKDVWAVQQPQRREEGDESVSLNAEPTVLAGCLCSVFRHQMCLHTCMCSVYTLDHPWNLHDKSTQLASSRPVSIMLSQFIHSRLHSILGPALALLRFAPVETAKAVHITVAGTASMVGEALHQTTSTLSAATEESVQQIARRTHTEKVSKAGCPLRTRASQTLPRGGVCMRPQSIGNCEGGHSSLAAQSQAF